VELFRISLYLKQRLTADAETPSQSIGWQLNGRKMFVSPRSYFLLRLLWNSCHRATLVSQKTASASELLWLIRFITYGRELYGDFI